MGVDSSAAHLFTKQLNSGSTSWVNMSNGSFITAYSPGSLGHTTIRQFNNRMWAAGDIVDKPGKIHHLAVYDTSWTVFADTGDFFPYALETTSNSLFLTGKFGSISNQSLNNIAGISSLLATIRGKVYRDRDSNCTFNKGDDSLENRILSLDGGAAYFNTDAHGNYQVLTSVGTHTLHLLNQKNWVQTCPAGLGDLTVITVADNVYSGRNFASNLKPGIRDLRASISPTSRLHPGRTASYTMNYENLGSVSIDTAYLVISFDKRLSNFRADSTPVTDSGSYVIFAVRNLKSLEKRHFNFYLDAITTITTGDTLDISVRADSGLTYVDSNLVNNFDTLYEGVSNSHDPNGKVVAPDGNIAPSTEELKYTILFQNTGNDYAYQVVVIDSIDTNLPLTEIVMNSSSHKYSFNVDNNVFRWTFKDINLIDSNADPVNSRGYISFTAKIKKGLGVGTEIKNKAYIYFDYNPPVKTNETMCKLSLKSGIQKESFLSESIKLYPNPANDELLLENRSPETRQFIIYSSLGKQMQSLKIGKNQNEILNTSLYPAGIYVIRGDKGEFAKIIVQH